MPSWTWEGLASLLYLSEPRLTARSNGIRFSITSLAPPNSRLLTPVFSTRAPISLFDALTPSASGLVFPPETITSVSSTLTHFRRLAILHGVVPAHIMVLATEAMRRAANSADMLDAIAKATDGLGVHVLDPPVETLLGAVMGSRSGLVNVNDGALFLDLGGGRVQMTWVDTSKDGYEINAALAGESLPYGAAKLNRVLNDEKEDVQLMEIDKLQAGIKRVYANLCSKFPVLQAIHLAHEKGENALVNVYMCGGGFRGYGSMLMHTDPISPYPIPSINNYTVDGPRFKETTKMRQTNQTFDAKIFGMSKRRREQFPAIATVVEAFVAAVPNIRRVTFCGGSNRTGALMMKLPKEIRESNPLDVLANVTEAEKPAFDALLRKLETALPQGVDFSGIPTILSTGLGPLFVRQLWARHGHDGDTNASFALHDAITRDSDCPGMSHLARAIFGLAMCARWGGGLGPADAQLQNGLSSIAEKEHAEAAFWAQYIGSVASVLASMFPSLPQPALLEKSIRSVSIDP